jgi:Uncharacterized conserved protein (COG2071)
MEAQTQASLIARRPDAPRESAPLWVTAPRALEPAGWQWLPVTAHIRERYLVTFRAPAAHVARLVPAPLEVDTRAGNGFISVCVLDMEAMGLAGTPRWLRWRNLELLYRVGVRVGGAPSFITLRSDVSARVLALLGRPFSHYRPHLADIARAPRADRFDLTCRTRDGLADATFETAAAPNSGATDVDSLFVNADDAAAFMLGMRFSADVRPDGRVRVQDIDHDPWGARFVFPARRSFTFVDRLARDIGAPLVYAHTLVMRDLEQTWRAARWL